MGGSCPGATLPNQGATCTLVLRFNPVAKGTRQADLTFNATDGRTYKVSLAGFAYPSASISERTAGSSSAPQYITKAPDGTYWYTQPAANRIARMTPAGDVAEYGVPTSAANPFDITAGQVDIGNAATDMTQRMTQGVLQPDGQLKVEPRMDVNHVAQAVAYMAGLPLESNVPFITVMATKMPLFGRG